VSEHLGRLYVQRLGNIVRIDTNEGDDSAKRGAIIVKFILIGINSGAEIEVVSIECYEEARCV
jgi:hypothetical protein